MSFGINTAPEEHQRRQTEHVSDLSGIAVISDYHSVFGCELRFSSAKMRLWHEEVRYLDHLFQITY